MSKARTSCLHAEVPALRHAGMATESATIQNADENTMFKKRRNFKQGFQLFGAEYYWKLFISLYRGLLDCLIIETFGPEKKLETENSEFKIRFRGAFLFQVNQVLFDLLQIQFCRKTIKMQR